MGGRRSPARGRLHRRAMSGADDWPALPYEGGSHPDDPPHGRADGRQGTSQPRAAAAMPFGTAVVTIGIDVYANAICVQVSDGRCATVPLGPNRSVADIWAPGPLSPTWASKSTCGSQEPGDGCYRPASPPWPISTKAVGSPVARAVSHVDASPIARGAVRHWADHEPRVGSTGDNRRHVGASRTTPPVIDEGDGGQP